MRFFRDEKSMIIVYSIIVLICLLNKIEYKNISIMLSTTTGEFLKRRFIDKYENVLFRENSAYKNNILKMCERRYDNAIRRY